MKARTSTNKPNSTPPNMAPRIGQKTAHRHQGDGLAGQHLSSVGPETTAENQFPAYQPGEYRIMDPERAEDPNWLHNKLMRRKPAGGSENPGEKPDSFVGNFLQREETTEEKPDEETAAAKLIQREEATEEKPDEDTASAKFIQREEAPEEKSDEDTASAKFIQREEVPEEKPDEETASAKFIQREEVPEEKPDEETAAGKLIQREEASEEKPDEETAAGKLIQREEATEEKPDEDTVAGKLIQREEIPEEKPEEDTATGKLIQREEATEEKPDEETAAGKLIQREEATEEKPDEETAAGKLIQREEVTEEKADEETATGKLIQRMEESEEKPDEDTTAAIQTKLKVGAPNDAHEQEADKKADEVMKMPTSSEQRMGQEESEEKPDKETAAAKQIQREETSEEKPNEETATGKHIQRMEESENKEEEVSTSTLLLRTKSTQTGPRPVNEIAAGNIQTLRRGGGRPLSGSERAFFEPRFQRDFSRVRLHTDENAARASASVNARAFTLGRDVFFNRGEYNPGTDDGKKLMAHELTHTVQQGAMKRKEMRQEAYRSNSEIPGFTENHSGAQEKIQREPGLHEEYELAWAGESVNQAGRISKKYIFLYSKPLFNESYKKVYLPFNNRVTVKAYNRSNRQWVYVESLDGSGRQGWMDRRFVAYPVPDAESTLHYVASGETLDGLVKKHYPSRFRVSGDDARSLVKAVYLTNQKFGRAGVRINSSKLKNAKGDTLANVLDGIDSYRGSVRILYQSVELVSGMNIWMPGESYITSLKTAGELQVRNGILDAVIRIAKGYGGYVTGVVEGFARSIADVFIGLYDMVGGLIDTVRNIISGEIMNSVNGFIELIKSIKTPADIIKLGNSLLDAIAGFIVSGVRDFRKKWMNPDTFERWRFRGNVVGYILAEVLMLIFTGSIANATKWLGKFGKIGSKVIKIINNIERKLPKALKRKKGRPEFDREHREGNKKTRQLPIALGMARGIAEMHDKKDSPLYMLMHSLWPLKNKFKWIKKFTYRYLRPGHYQIIMLASRHPFFNDYTPGNIPNSGGLLKNEGKVDTYKELLRKGSRGDNLTPHHVPSDAYMKGKGIPGYEKSKGICINMEQPSGPGGRHRFTSSYGSGPDLNLTPRDVLEREVADVRRIYRTQGLYTPAIKKGLNKLMQKNIRAWPGVFDTKRGISVIDPKKFNYLFGKGTGNAHNIEQSVQNLRQLNKIGIHNNAQGRALLQKHLESVAASRDNILKSFTNEYGTFQVKESLFTGPGGLLKFESTWQVLENGTLKFITLKPFGGN